VAVSPEESVRVLPPILMSGSLFLLALGIRALQYPLVFSPIGIQLPFTGDPYYHLRRIWFSVARFPETLPFDSYVSFPAGSQIVWPSTFDWTISALIRPFVDPTDQAAVEAIAVWAPAALGAFTTGAVALLAWRLYGRGSGWCAGLLYAVLPMSFNFSQLGMIDHHVAVALLTIPMLWIGSELFSLDDRAESWSAAMVLPSTRWSVALGLVMAFSILTWPGALLHLCVIQSAFGARWLIARHRSVARARAIAFATGQAVLAISIAPFTLGMVWREYGSWSPLVLSNMQPVYFASAAMMICLAQGLHERSSLGESRGRRIASALALAVAGALAALVVLPSMREAIVYAGGWFTHGEELLGQINEMRPIFMQPGYFSLLLPLLSFGPGFMVLPLVWLYLTWRVFAERSPRHGFLLYWSLAFIVLTLTQWRFGNTLAVAYVVLIGSVLAEWMSGIRRRIGTRPWRLIAEIVLVSGFVVSTAIVHAVYYKPLVVNNLEALEDEQSRARGPLRPVDRIFDQASRWIAHNTPKTRGYLDATLQPEYGVLAGWGNAHLLRYRAERPLLQDHFGPYAGRESFESAWAYFAARDETAAIEILERLGVRYVVSRASGAGSLAGLAPDAMAMRLAMDFGSFKSANHDYPTPGLSRHRLIFHTRSEPLKRGKVPLRASPPNQSIGVWEVVPGARIKGNGDPGDKVHLALDLETSSRGIHVYRLRSVVDATGRYEFVVPYPTDVEFSPDVRAASDYEIRISRTKSQLAIPEADVQSGGVVSGPDFRTSSPARSCGGSPEPCPSGPRSARAD
jgi:asparagine N-glycosylation enzyme membrane subunit Stt3